MGQFEIIVPEVRLITADDDITELTSLLHRGYRTLVQRGVKFPASYQMDETTRCRISRGECYLAFHDQKLIGTITLNDMQHTHGSPWLDRPDVASFRQFTVEPSLRRHGIGSYLLQYVERRAAIIGADRLALDTAEPATDLIQFYTARGYRFIEYVRWDGENYRSVVMSKRISRSGLGLSSSYTSQMSPIRRYRPGDHQSLMSFLEGVLTEMGHAFLPDQKDSDIRDIEAVYTLNRGAFHVIDMKGQIRGSIGLRRHSDDVAELKRLYVARECRSNGLGYALCIAAMDDAKQLGYRFLRLDTTRQSVEAIGLFKKLGFREIDRYNDDPFAELFMEKSL